MPGAVDPMGTGDRAVRGDFQAMAPSRRPPLVRRPAFLVGCVRSGTTLLRLMLDHHPEIAFGPEFEYAIDLVGDDGRPPELAAFHRYLGGHRIFLDSGRPIDPALDFEGLVDDLLGARGRALGRRVIGATVHVHFDRLLSIWPDARFIHLVRDGRDVARSMVEIGFAGNAYAAAGHWAEVEQLWSELALAVPAERRHEVRYEDLVADPGAVLGRICAFLGVEDDPRMLEYPADTTYRPPIPGRHGRWRLELAPGEVDQVESRIAGMLSRRGYPLAGRPVRPLGPREHRRLVGRHRLNRARFRIARYGPTTWLLDAFARRFGPAGLARWTGRRIDEVDRRHLA